MYTSNIPHALDDVQHTVPTMNRPLSQPFSEDGMLNNFQFAAYETDILQTSFYGL
jgi:hypothetical protein